MLNFAIIGCGSIGSRHAAHIPGKLRAVCDIEHGRASALAEARGARAYFTPEDLLEREKGLDVVAVCTPNGLHALHTIQSLRAGCHVVCEKPMAIHAADGRKMIEEAHKADRQLFVVKQNRFNPPVVALRNWLKEGKLGRIYSVQLNCFWNRDEAYYRNSWRGTMEMDGGILYTQFSHFIDLMQWIMGEVKDVYAFTDNYAHQEIIAFEDSGVACLRFENGAIGSLHFTVNSYRKNMEGSLTLIGEKGTVKIGGEYLNLLEYAEMEEKPDTELPTPNPANHYGSYQGSMSNHDKMYGHVSDVIERGYPNQFNGSDGLRTIEIIEQIYSAAKRDKSI